MADPIVFVPGLLCTHVLYAPQIEVLAGKVECTVADHTRHDSMPGIAASILDGAPDRFALVGLSMGGYIALEMAALAPERISAMALLDTTARPDRPEQTAFRRELMALAERDGIDPVIDRLLPLFIDDSRLDDKDLVATVHKMARDTGTEAFIRQETAIIGRRDARPDLVGVGSPTLVICGDRDRLTPPELAEEIVAGIRGARLEMIEGSGHLTTLEKPDAVNAALIDLLRP